MSVKGEGEGAWELEGLLQGRGGGSGVVVGQPVVGGGVALLAETTSSGLGSVSTSQEDEELCPYIIVSDIGKGSFATVYTEGYHENNHKSVAIKTILHQKLSAKLFKNLQSKIQILKSLSHRHITKLIDIRTNRNIYLIMEYYSGGDLTNYIKKRSRVKMLEYIPDPY
ncbi:kinase-like domain-containing protein [Mycena albidolilacea]|uniref:non-specific serine/threonine protein kinase n=1 Tax=Mycena albidolilacea TaxID=1033008 RepID=A0AAD6ZT19_9AGAR|nr:kinase-like domain-containing protein [Mycena albidolilacea]